MTGVIIPICHCARNSFLCRRNRWPARIAASRRTHDVGHGGFRTAGDRGPATPPADSAATVSRACTCDPAQRTLTAPPAPKLVPKGNYGISIWAHVSLDNNASERALRGAALARKNFYGSGAFWSGRLAATMLSLLATLRHWKLSPKKWLTAYFESCAAAGGKAPDDIQPVISMHHRQGFPDAISFLSCSSALALTIYRGL